MQQSIYYFSPSSNLASELEDLSETVASSLNMHIARRSLDLDQEFQQVFRATSSKWSLWFGPSFGSSEFLLSHSHGQFNISILYPKHDAFGEALEEKIRAEISERSLEFSRKDIPESESVGA
jgi:hypothetical protein